MGAGAGAERGGRAWPTPPPSVACPKLRTADGFEMQFGTNHLGHYALTNRLLPLLEAPPDQPARVLTV